MSDTLESIHSWDKTAWRQVDALLAREGIRRDANLDYTCGIFDGDRRLAATGSAFGNTLRCFAVDKSRQGEGLLNQIVSHLMDYQAERGLFHLFVYTKTKSAKFFQDLGFREIARALGVTARYVGEEPASQVTGLYNHVLAEELPRAGVRCVVVPRLARSGAAVSASTVRALIHDGKLEDIRPLVPESTWSFFSSAEAAPVIQAIRESGQVIHY